MTAATTRINGAIPGQHEKNSTLSISSSLFPASILSLFVITKDTHAHYAYINEDVDHTTLASIILLFDC